MQVIMLMIDLISGMELTTYISIVGLWENMFYGIQDYLTMGLMKLLDYYYQIVPFIQMFIILMDLDLMVSHQYYIKIMVKIMVLVEVITNILEIILMKMVAII